MTMSDSMSYDLTERPEEEEEDEKSIASSDASNCSSFLGVWSDFLQYSFQSLTHTEEVEGQKSRNTRSISLSPSTGFTSIYFSRDRASSDMTRRDIVKHLQADMKRRDFMEHVVGAASSDSSIMTRSSSKSVPPQSPTLACDVPQNEQQQTSARKRRPLATAVATHLLPSDVGRKVVIVRARHQRNTSFQLDENDLDDEPWFC